MEDPLIFKDDFYNECPIHGKSIFRMYRKKKIDKQEFYCVECQREVLNNRSRNNKERIKMIMRNCKKHGLSIFVWEKSNKRISGGLYRCQLCKREMQNKRNKLYRAKMKIKD
jgi:hypothetical protein